MESIRRRSDLLIVKSSESLGRECYWFHPRQLGQRRVDLPYVDGQVCGSGLLLGQYLVQVVVVDLTLGL